MAIKFKNLEKFSKGKTGSTYKLELPTPKSSSGKTEMICKNLKCKPQHFMMGPRSENIILELDKKSFKFEPGAVGVNCPYCGEGNYEQNLISERDKKAAVKMVEEAVYADAANAISDMLSKAFGSNRSRSSSRGGFSISTSVKSSPKAYPKYARPYREDLLRNTECLDCGRCYGVYALAFFCPDCGNSNFMQHFNHESVLIDKQLALSVDVKESGDSELACRLVGNALEDSLTVFETFLKRGFLLLEKEYNKNFLEQSKDSKNIKSHSLKNTEEKDLKSRFQNLYNAHLKYLDIGIDIKLNVSETDLQIISSITQKRHVIGHNLSLMDSNMVEKLDVDGEGKTVPIAAKEVQDFLTSCVCVLKNVDNGIKGIKLERVLT